MMNFHICCFYTQFISRSHVHCANLWHIFNRCSIAHPYLLADNRHYTFYLWRKVIKAHWSMKYLLVPLYVYSWLAICSRLGELSSFPENVYWLSYNSSIQVFSMFLHWQGKLTGRFGCWDSFWPLLQFWFLLHWLSLDTIPSHSFSWYFIPMMMISRAGFSWGLCMWPSMSSQWWCSCIGHSHGTMSLGPRGLYGRKVLAICLKASSDLLVRGIQFGKLPFAKDFFFF